MTTATQHQYDQVCPTDGDHIEGHTLGTLHRCTILKNCNFRGPVTESVPHSCHKKEHSSHQLVSDLVHPLILPICPVLLILYHAPLPSMLDASSPRSIDTATSSVPRHISRCRAPYSASQHAERSSLCARVACGHRCTR
eukprot:IDg9315t1